VLVRIGRHNTRFIRHICISFPAFHFFYTGRVALREDGVRTLELIRQYCTGITTLETSPETTREMEITIDDLYGLDSAPIAAKALALVNAQFKNIQSLKEVVVNMYGFTLCVDPREEIRGLGWRIVLSWFFTGVEE
jgi:hypothetical protein